MSTASRISFGRGVGSRIAPPPGCRGSCLDRSTETGRASGLAGVRRDTLDTGSLVARHAQIAIRRQSLLEAEGEPGAAHLSVADIRRFFSDEVVDDVAEIEGLLEVVVDPIVLAAVPDLLLPAKAIVVCVGRDGCPVTRSRQRRETRNEEVQLQRGQPCGRCLLDREVATGGSPGPVRSICARLRSRPAGLVDTVVAPMNNAADSPIRFKTRGFPDPHGVGEPPNAPWHPSALID